MFTLPSVLAQQPKHVEHAGEVNVLSIQLGPRPLTYTTLCCLRCTILYYKTIVFERFWPLGAGMASSENDGAVVNVGFKLSDSDFEQQQE